MKAGYPRRWRDRVALVLYDLLWIVATPLVVAYLWRRGRKEPLYSQHLEERFGRGPVHDTGALWIHAVSLGELRAARPLIDALVARGERVLLTTITAAGRGAAQEMFADAIERELLHLCWAPMDGRGPVRRFLRRHRPRAGIILEIELWPGLIAGAGRAGVPLIMAQAQYPEKSFERDRGGAGFRAAMIGGFDLILAKSETHGARFRQFGASDVRAVGEMRFEQMIPEAHLQAAADFRRRLAGREVFCLASTHPEEDALLIPVLQSLKAQVPGAFFVYVPRHPQHFATSGARLAEAGLKMLQRSKDLNADLSGGPENMTAHDGLLGDSLGEINFYFALADRVFMGDSLIDEGSHNIIEPMALGKPVAVGPSIWGIEYPAAEALAEGVLSQVESAGGLLDLWRAPVSDEMTTRIEAFTARHGGATARILTALEGEGLI